jgi:transcriptional regulator with XRE-family HTH domain
MAEGVRKFAGGRLQLAMKTSANYKKALHLDNSLGTKGKVGTWASGKHDPSGAFLERMCALLSASPLYLYGGSREEIREYLEAVVRRELGDAEADALEAVGRLDEEEKSRVMVSLAPPAPPSRVPPVGPPREPWQDDRVDGASGPSAPGNERSRPAGAARPRRG